MISVKQLTWGCLFLVCFLSCKTKNQDATTNSITYDNLLQEFKTLGISTGNLLVYKNGQIVHQSASGLRSINPIDSLNLDSQFRLASVSKQFTGMSIMKLKEAGKLDYDQKVNSILTDFPYDTITIRHLLHHVSGLEDYERMMHEHWQSQDTTGTETIGNNKIMKVFFERNPKLRFMPGDKYEYSNTGYLILASIVEKISGQHFREFLKENIFEPVGMKNTLLYSYQVDADPTMPNRVFGYNTALNQVDLVSDDYHLVNDVRGDGGIYSTVEDLYKWNLALANHTIIAKEYLDEAFTPGVLNNGEKTRYGFGWGLNSDDGKEEVFHSGGWVGFRTFLFNDLKTKSGLVLLTNNSNDNFFDILNGAKNILTDQPVVLPKRALHKEMAQKIIAENIESGIRHYQAKKLDTTTYHISERTINVLGYQFLAQDHLEEALKIFELNINEYPNSANTYDSYGDALLVKGDSLKALQHFKKCYQMDTTLTYAKDKAAKLEALLK
ncbi:serine hydrolase [Aquimarina gracilis]|uniref:Serine hydrolase n=1 Tax=Aquimarina gracilis TaxID=874422 RepID=A0ABU5ZTW4_9FLAO|nr:serine hydrolase [Aquimarina gracilis]MEB3344987.1 serine hydrolase [Aquimarina gracilis]